MYTPPASDLEHNHPMHWAIKEYPKVLFFIWLGLTLFYVAYRYRVDFRLAAEISQLQAVPHRELVRAGLEAAYETTLIMLPSLSFCFLAGRKIANGLSRSFVVGLKLNSLMSLVLGGLTGVWVIILEQTRFLFLTKSRNSPEVFIPMFFGVVLIIFVLFFGINIALSSLQLVVKRIFPQQATA